MTMSSLYTSTTHGDGTWAYAVDGITDQDWYTGGCASSNREANPWLLLDLGGPFTVTALKIYNRGDGSLGKDFIRGMQYTKGYNVGWFKWSMFSNCLNYFFFWGGGCFRYM